MGPQSHIESDNSPDSGSAGSVRWVADEYRDLLRESDAALARTADRAEEIEKLNRALIEEIRNAEDEFVVVTKDGVRYEDKAAFFSTLIKAHSVLGASNKNTSAIQESGRKTRANLLDTAEVRESRQEAEINKATAAALQKLKDGRH